MSCNLVLLQTGIVSFASGMALLISAILTFNILDVVEKKQVFAERNTMRKQLKETSTVPKPLKMKYLV